MKAAYLKSPNQFKLKDVTLRDPAKDEVIVRVMACGFCGHDKILASYHAKDWEPFGHEFSGIVEEIGSDVTHLKVGDRVVIETSTFDPLSYVSQAARPDLDNSGPNYMSMNHTAMGFAEKTVVPAVLCVPFKDLSFEEACFIEPMGVAYDLILTSEIKLGNDVVVMGCGAIGLMAIQMAKASGARKVYAVEHVKNKKKATLALQYGADEVIYSDVDDLTQFHFPRGGVERVLVTTPPVTIDIATKICNMGGIVSYLGITYGEGSIVSFDSNIVHLNKIQIRGSNAIPAIYFPQCINLVKAGIVNVKQLISHTFPLENAPEGILQFLSDSDIAVKAVMVQTDTYK
ncbi:MAG: zinc-binding dehydrogenase [Eubacteriales bacterium]